MKMMDFHENDGFSRNDGFPCNPWIVMKIREIHGNPGKTCEKHVPPARETRAGGALRIIDLVVDKYYVIYLCSEAFLIHQRGMGAGARTPSHARNYAFA